MTYLQFDADFVRFAGGSDSKLGNFSTLWVSQMLLRNDSQPDWLHVKKRVIACQTAYQAIYYAWPANPPFYSC